MGEEDGRQERGQDVFSRMDRGEKKKGVGKERLGEERKIKKGGGIREG